MEVDDATVCPSVSVAVRVRVCIGACVCCIFIVHAWPEAAVLDCSWYGPETDPGYNQWHARGELGLQVAYGAGLGGK